MLFAGNGQQEKKLVAELYILSGMIYSYSLNSFESVRLVTRYREGWFGFEETFDSVLRGVRK